MGTSDERRTPTGTDGKRRWTVAVSAVATRLRFVLLLGVIALIATTWDDVADLFSRWTHGASDRAGVNDGVARTEFFCPMHPSVVSEAAGKCPSCGMPFSERVPSAATTLPDGVTSRVSLSPYRVAQAGIRTAAVAWAPLELEVQGTGVLRYDETRVWRLSAGSSGRIVSIEQSFDGARIARGTPVLRLVSEALQSMVQSYLTSVRQLKDAESRSASAGVERLKAQTLSLHRQLVQSGLDPDQFTAEGGASDITDDGIILRAPFDCVVLHCEVRAGQQIVAGTPLVHLADPSAVIADVRVPRADARWLRNGLQAAIVDPVDTSVRCIADVAHVSPDADERTQTVTVRLAIREAHAGLRPGTFVRGVVRVPMCEVEPWRSLPRASAAGTRTVYECPPHNIVASEPGVCTACGGMTLIRREIAAGPQPGDVLAVPETSVVDTGGVRVVYVESSAGVFDARRVVLGPRIGGSYPVVSGVEAGMRVATAGAFLIDAETRLDPGTAGTYFGATQGLRETRDAPGVQSR